MITISGTRRQNQDVFASQVDETDVTLAGDGIFLLARSWFIGARTGLKDAFHVISGLPRSGSVLIAAILRQNPAVHAGMSSPLLSLVQAMLRGMSQENEGAPFLDDAKREAVLRGVVAGYHADLGPGVAAIDTNRGWCAKLPLLARLYPEAKVVACVRDVSWIMDSVERVVRANPLEPSRMFGFDPGGTVYSRVGALAASDGLVGFALDALREAFFSPEAAGRLMILTYETLVAAPARALEAIYGFLGLPAFAHDFETISYDAEEFDRRLGASGLHRVARRVTAPARATILPPALFARFAGDAFWRDGANPHGIAVV